MKTAHISFEQYIIVEASKHLLEWSPDIPEQLLTIDQCVCVPKDDHKKEIPLPNKKKPLGYSTYMRMHKKRHTHVKYPFLFSRFRDPKNPGTLKNWGIYSVCSIMVKGNRQVAPVCSHRFTARGIKLFSLFLSGWAHIYIIVQKAFKDRTKKNNFSLLNSCP